MIRKTLQNKLSAVKRGKLGFASGIKKETSDRAKRAQKRSGYLADEEGDMQHGFDAPNQETVGPPFKAPVDPPTEPVVDDAIPALAEHVIPGTGSTTDTDYEPRRRRGEADAVFYKRIGVATPRTM